MTHTRIHQFLTELDARVDWAHDHGTPDELRTWQAARKLSKRLLIISVYNSRSSKLVTALLRSS